MERDDNSQQKFEQDQEQEWYEHNRKLLNGIGMITHSIEVEGVAHRKKMEDLSKPLAGRLSAKTRKGN